MVSECIMSLLVLMLANGWYTRFKSFDFDDGLEVYAPLWMLVLIIHIIFGALTFIDNDAYHKYHDFHGWPGYCIILSKFILVGVFWYFHTSAREQIQKDSMVFYKQFVPVGIGYLLSDPLIILSSFFLAEYNRQMYYRIVDQSIHLALQAYILYQLMHTKSSFKKSVHAFTSLPTTGPSGQAEKNK